MSRMSASGLAKRCLVLVFLAGGFVFPGTALAASIAVTTTQDPVVPGSECSLRHAITSAQTDTAVAGCAAGSGEDTILLPQGLYVTFPGDDDENGNLDGDFDVFGSDSLTIKPATADARVTVSGTAGNRVLHHTGTGLLTLIDLTVSEGSATSTEFRFGYGGGINSSSRLSLSGVSVIGNSSDGNGGGIYTAGGLEMVNSTIAGNSSKGGGGGLVIFGSEPVSIKSSTIARNNAPLGAGFSVSGVNPREGYSATVTLTHVLLAQNLRTETECYIQEFLRPRFFLTTQPTGPDTRCVPDEGEPEDGIIRVQDAGLGSLYSTGRTPMIGLEPGSPAIRAGGTAGEFGCPATDQAGRPRHGGRCDIGAVQYDGRFPFTSLKLTVPKRRIILGSGRQTKPAKFRASFRGAGLADGASLCLRPTAWRRAIRVIGKRCRHLGTLDSRSPVITPFRLKKRFMAKPGIRSIPAVLRAPRFVKREVKLKVRLR